MHGQNRTISDLKLERTLADGKLSGLKLERTSGEYWKIRRITKNLGNKTSQF